MPDVICRKCSSKFHVKPSHLNMGYGKYCSRTCHHKGMQKRELKKCFTCRDEIFRTKSRLKNSQSRKYFCNKSCQTKWRNSVYIGEKHKNWRGGIGIDYRGILLKSGIQEACMLCRISDKRILAAHHIDENRKNNKIKNLVWLCHNCHHEVHYDKIGKQKLVKMTNK